jgi:tRNA A37 threonylcarbamoyladenosine dehydratase
MTLLDGDTFDISNLNRQPFATASVIGQPKAIVTAHALQDIAPTCPTHPIQQFLTPENIPSILEQIQPEIVVDAIDDIPAKIALLHYCYEHHIPVWSSMGAARKWNPLDLRVTDIAKTAICPLARHLRQGLRKLGITKGIRCVWSQEPPTPHTPNMLASFMPVTATAGLLLAADLIQTIAKQNT